MRPAFLFVACIFTCSLAIAQIPSLDSDTVYYKNSKFFSGSQIQILFGSGQDSNFVYAFLVGESRAIKNFRKNDLYPLSPTYAKGKVKVIRVFSIHGKYYAKGVPIDRVGDKLIEDSSIVIDIKGAIDSQEIWED